MPHSHRSLGLATLFLLGVSLIPSPSFAAGWKPKQAALMTRWAKDVDPAKPHPEYPRPQFVREAWQNLNGLWDYAVRPKNESQPQENNYVPLQKVFPMKKMLLLATVVVLCAVSSFTYFSKPAEANEIKWMTWKQMQEAQKKQPRKIVVDVYTGWCGWCKYLVHSTRDLLGRSACKIS